MKERRPLERKTGKKNVSDFWSLALPPCPVAYFSPFSGSQSSSSVKWRRERGKGKVKRVKGREERICLLLQGGKGCESVSGHFTGDKLGEGLGEV